MFFYIRLSVPAVKDRLVIMFGIYDVRIYRCYLKFHLSSDSVAEHAMLGAVGKKNNMYIRTYLFIRQNDIILSTRVVSVQTEMHNYYYIIYRITIISCNE